ncbi:Phenolic acid decarboxylase subunit C [Pigmentiphaga humi]|uniref:Phenolic acid decarboxylase subunit C n=1 Tax=Pigmentiphaga humi TaxID=2478468 RepID=A0A3P4AZ41_9BURK|nr:UbiD family decarboxylase [Pigmentiphaga humi]VCU69349.1 Phenolic acid decarboxylase subunit C [Pigmentiphaga humi]
MTFTDLRGFIAEVDKLGQLRHVREADKNGEIGAVTEVAAGMPVPPALLFDHIPGHEPGFRVFSNPLMTPQRSALALRLDPRQRPLEILEAWLKKRQALRMLAPAETADGRCFEHSLTGDAVDVTAIPAPVWHRQDGGPYIGAGSIVVMRDPDTGWINASIYRVQVHGPRRVTVQFDHMGRHGAVIARKYWDRGRPCPLAVVNGGDPALFMAGFESLPLGASELEFAGAIRGEPLAVCPGPVTGLPIPADAEIVLEGELLPMSTDALEEGPFAEFTGYYADDKRPAPVMEVLGLHYRDDPILLGSPPLKPPHFHVGVPMRVGGMWASLTAAGVSDITGIWQHMSSLMTVVALKQRYDGHARRAAMVAAGNAYMGRLVVVVDEDIDPSNLNEVMWAVATRCEPSESVDILRNGWSSALDPRIPPALKELGVSSNSKLILDATRPYVWREQFPIPSALDVQERRAVEDKWLDLLRG